MLRSHIIGAAEEYNAEIFSIISTADFVEGHMYN